MSALIWLGVAALGSAGALLRFFVDGVVTAQARRTFPVGTLVVNLSGAFGLGLLTGLVVTPDTSTVAGTATIGSYTTFSTWMLETHRLAEAGDTGWAVVNVVGSLAAGLGAAALGRLIGSHL